MVIDSRAEMVNALTEAAELEHGLPIQYLFWRAELEEADV
jgi:hypothetical protein